MAKKSSTVANLAINSVALEDDITSFNLDVKQEVPVVTALADAGPRRVVGNYDYGLGLEGNADFASGQSDATLFGLIGSGGVAMAVDPTGESAGPNDPNYDATSVVLESYSLKGSVGNPVSFSSQLQGNSALSRAVA